MTAERLQPAHRRSVLLVIVVTQLVVALLTGTVIAVAYEKLDKNSARAGRSATASTSSDSATASHSTSW